MRDRPLRVLDGLAGRAAAWLAMLALVLPALLQIAVPNPDLLPSAEGVGHHEHGAPYSPVPGSAGHPADHECQPCQILKYQAGFLPSPAWLPPATASRALKLIVRTNAQRTEWLAEVPRSRAPPTSS